MSRPVAPQFALGLASLGRPAYMTVGHSGDLPDKSREGLFRQSFEVLDAAYAQGIRRVDVARSYGIGEEILAGWLESRNPEVFVSSKWGYRYTAGLRVDAEVNEVKDHSLGHLESQWKESFGLLGKRLSLYQIHSATLESGVLDDRGVLDFLARIKSEHGIQVGLSVTGEGQGAVIEKALSLGDLFSSVQATWNLLERSAGPALIRAKAAGWMVMIKEPLSNGRLTSRGGVEALSRQAQKTGFSEDALALAAIRAQPFADVVLLGATTVPQLLSNLKAAQIPHPLASLEAVSALPPPSYWAQRSHLPWT